MGNLRILLSVFLVFQEARVNSEEFTKIQRAHHQIFGDLWEFPEENSSPVRRIFRKDPAPLERCLLTSEPIPRHPLANSIPRQKLLLTRHLAFPY